MSNGPKGLYKLGGISFIVSGALFLLKSLFDFKVGPPPSTGAEILAWATAGKFPLAMANEALFIAAIFLVPAVIALYRSLASTDATKAAVGCGIIAVTIPIMATLDIVQGRLIYPVYDLIANTTGAAELVVGIFYGGLHAVALLMGVATIVLSLAMRRGAYGRNVAFLGFATGMFDVIGSYPWLIGTVLVLVSQVFFAAWFLAVGAKLYRMPQMVPPPSAGRA